MRRVKAKKTSHRNDYRALFVRLGFPLTLKDGIPETQLAKAEKELGVRLPQALRDYFLVTGKEKKLNHVFNRLCFPGELEVDSDKLIFMEENQTVVVWGMNAGTRPAKDPPVFQATVVDGAPHRWCVIHKHCSAFLKFMLHLQAAYGGGMPCTASAPAPDDLSPILKRGWLFGGEVNGMRAYSQERRVVCLTEWQDFGAKQKSWRVFAGATTKEDLDAIGAELKLKWD